MEREVRNLLGHLVFVDREVIDSQVLDRVALVVEYRDRKLDGRDLDHRPELRRVDKLDVLGLIAACERRDRPQITELSGCGHIDIRHVGRIVEGGERFVVPKQIQLFERTVAGNVELCFDPDLTPDTIRRGHRLQPHVKTFSSDIQGVAVTSNLVALGVVADRPSPQSTWAGDRG